MFNFKFFCSFMLSIVLSVFCFLANVRADWYEIKVDDALIVRKGPSSFTEFLGSLSNGERVDVLEIRQSWGRINYNGQDGWICLNYAVCVQEYVVRVNDALRVRSGPTTSSDVLGSLTNGKVLRITQVDGEWGKITYDGKDGWVCMRFLEKRKCYDTVRPVRQGTSVITQEYKGDAHKGIDIGSYRGVNVDVFSVKKGLVLEAVENKEYNGGMGNYVIIKHDGGYVSKYFHLNSVVVRQGDNVETGQKIGVMGTTGNSTGVHLHLQIELDSRHIDPLQFVNPVC